MTGDIKCKIDAVWNAFWAGGIANSLDVIVQITYLLFLRWWVTDFAKIGTTHLHTCYAAELRPMLSLFD
jgi:hypothetical protein